MISDPYKVLGVSPDSTEEDITKAYRKLAKKYHPDVNRDNPDAVKRMSEINAAYDMIKSGKTNESSQSNTYTYQERQQGQYRDPFSGFDPFGAFGGFGPFGSRRPYGGATHQDRNRASYGNRSPYDPVINYIRAGYFREALNILSGMSEKTAEWHYYCALANIGAGNRITAYKHAQTAVEMDPSNEEYLRLLEIIQSGANTYRQERSNYGIPVYNMDKICLGICLARICCLFCR